MQAKNNSEKRDDPKKSARKKIASKEQTKKIANIDNAVRESSLKESIIIRSTPVLLNADEVVIAYPARAKRLMIEGIVKLRLKLDEFGKVILASILSGPEFGLKEGALEIASKLKFLPATDECGVPIRSEVDHEVIFKLNRL